MFIGYPPRMPEGASILIKAGRVVDPGSGANGPADVTIVRGVISFDGCAVSKTQWAPTE